MVDFRRDVLFRAALVGLENEIEVLSSRGIPDAAALASRREGANNLQGHYHSVLPLALWFCRRYSQALGSLRGATSIYHEMTSGSSESRDRTLWVPIQQDLIAYLNRSGNDILAAELSSGSPQTAGTIADTYLSTRFGGSHARGGAGDTVFKRATKLLAHLSLG